MPLMLGGALPTTALVMRKQGELGPPEHPLENALQGLLQLQSIADAQAGFVESGPGVSPPPKGPPRGKGPAGGKPTTSSSGAKRRQQKDGPAPVAADASGQEELPQRDGTVVTASRTAVLPVTAAGYGPPPARQMMQHTQPAPRGRPPAASSLGPEAYVSNTPNAGVRVMRPVLRPPPPPPAPPQHQPGTQLLHAPDQAQQLLRVGGRGYGGAMPRPAASGRSRSASPPSTSTASPPPYHLVYHQGAAGSSGMPPQQPTGSRMPPGHSAGGMRVGSGAVGPGAPSGPGGRPMPTAGGSSGSTGARPMGHHQQQAMGAQQQEKPLDAPAAMGPRPLKPGAGKQQHPMPSVTDQYHLHQAHQGGSSEMRPPPAPAAAAARRGTWGPNVPLVGAGGSAHGHPPPLPAGQHRSPPYQYPAMPRPAPGQARGPPAPSGARGLMQPQSTVKRPAAAGPVAPPPTYVSSRAPGAGVQAHAPSGHHVQQQQPQQPSPGPAGPRLPQPQPGSSSMVGPHSLAKHHQQANDFPQQQSGSPAAHRPHPVQQQQQHPFNPSSRTRQPTQQQQQQPQYHYPQHNQQQYDTAFQPQPPSHMHHLHQQQQPERPQKMMRGAPAPGPAAPRGALRPSTSQAPPKQQQHFAYPQHHQHAKPVAQHGHQHHLHAHLHVSEDLGRPPMAYGPPVSRKRPAPEPSLEEQYHHHEEDEEEGANGQQEEEGEGEQEDEPCDEYEEQQHGVPVGCDYAPMDHSGFPQYHSHHNHHHSPMYQGDGGGYAEDMVGSSGGGSEHGEDEMMMGHHVDYGSRGMMMEEGDYYELDDFQAQTLLVSIPTDSLDPATVIGSDPAQAKRLALAASNRASVSQDDHNLLISQEVMLVPSQVASPAILSQNQETRIKNLEKIPPAVVMALEAKLSTIPCWDVRITKEKLQQLGGIILVDSSPVLMQGERSEQVTNYAPKNFHIKCQHCNKSFHGKNALRNFELHAIFWELCKAHPAHPDRREAAAAAAAAAGSSTGSAQEDGKAGEAGSSSSSAAASEGAAAATAAAKFEMEHRQVYPCNSVSRDVVVFMEAKKPVLCNNQKKVWKLQGNLHHDTSLFQGRAWLQIPSGQSWESCKLADPISLQRFLCCRANKTLEQYETLRAHVFTWHDSGVFTACSTCNRVYQNTRAFLGHGCIRKGHDKDEQLVSNTVEQLLSLVDCSPDLARVFFQMQALSAARKQEVFDRVGKRLRAAPGTNC